MHPVFAGEERVVRRWASTVLNQIPLAYGSPARITQANPYLLAEGAGSITLFPTIDASAIAGQLIGNAVTGGGPRLGPLTWMQAVVGAWLWQEAGLPDGSVFAAASTQTLMEAVTPTQRDALEAQFADDVAQLAGMDPATRSSWLAKQLDALRHGALSRDDMP